MPVSTVAESSQTAFSMPALVGSVGEQEYAAGKQQSRLAGGGCEYVSMQESDLFEICMQSPLTGQHLDSTQAFASAQCF
jgi:hypothetical protein